MSNSDAVPLGERIGRAIARERQRCGLTQENVAEQLGIGNEAVSRIERGIVTPGLARLFNFAAIFQCEAGDLLGRSSPLVDDQARHIARLLTALTPADRELMIGLVEQLSERLAADTASPR